MRKARTIPENKSSILLLVKFSNFNPAKISGIFLRDNWLVNRVLELYHETANNCCNIWNKLLDQLSCIISTGQHQWAQDF